MEAYRFSMQHPAKGCQPQSGEGNLQDEYYKERSDKFVPTNPEYNGWGSKFSQYLRYDVITEEIKKDLCFNHFTEDLNCVHILDVGCGGRIYQQLIPEGWIYKGVERREGFDWLQATEEQLAECKCNYAVASGSMAFLEVPEVELFIERMFKVANCGVVFNLLDAKSDYMGDEPVVHVQRKRFFSYIYNKYRIQRNCVVTLRTDYLPNEDFTIGIFKQ